MDPALSFGGLLLFMGRAGDHYGRRRLFVGGLALFACASFLGGLAWAPWVLVLARLLQGVGGAALVPASLALVSVTFAEGEEQNRALGVYGAMAGVGFVFGMVLGGVITEFLGWRWVLFVNVPVAIAVLAPVVIHESKDKAAPRTLDPVGAATATLGFASLIYAVSEAPKNGWASPDTLVMGGLGAVFLGAFVAHERRASAPLVRLPIIGRRAVAVPNAAIVLKSMVGAAQLYVLTLYFQDALGRTPLEARLLFIPMTLASVVASPVAGRLTSRLGARHTAAWGYIVSGAGLVLVAWLIRTAVPASQVRPIPPDLMMVASNHMATAANPQLASVVHWDCKNEVTDEVTGPWVEPHQCESTDAKPRLKIVFPQCWDGTRLDSADHKAHTAYPKRVNGVYKCPRTHPVAITRVGLQFNYPAEGQPGWTNMNEVTFSAGGRFSGHADFWNTWRVDGENGFNSLNTRCLKESTFCGLGNQPR